jgi:hypothetical protein
VSFMAVVLIPAEALLEGVRRVEQELLDAHDVGRALDGGHHRVERAHLLRRANQSAGEQAADGALVDEVLVQGQLTAEVHLGHAGAGARPAGGAVQAARAVQDHVLLVRLRVRRFGGKHHVADAADAGVLRVDHPVAEVLVERGADAPPGVDKRVGLVRADRHPGLLGRQDGVEVAAVGDVAGDAADALHVRLHVRQDDARRHVLQGDGRNFVVLAFGGGVHQPRRRVQDQFHLGSGLQHHGHGAENLGSANHLSQSRSPAPGTPTRSAVAVPRL